MGHASVPRASSTAQSALRRQRRRLPVLGLRKGAEHRHTPDVSGWRGEIQYLLVLLLKSQSKISTGAYRFNAAETESWGKVPHSSQTVFPCKGSESSKGERQVTIAVLQQGPGTVLWNHPLRSLDIPSSHILCPLLIFHYFPTCIWQIH